MDTHDSLVDNDCKLWDFSISSKPRSPTPASTCPSGIALLREAISGTMSKFYKARDLRTGKIVGLKILDVEKTAAFEARFRGLKKPTRGRDRHAAEAPPHRRNAGIRH